MSLQQPPKSGIPPFDRWVTVLWQYVLSLPTATSPAGSTTDHALLQDLNSTNYAHLTLSQSAALTKGGDASTLHFHSSDRNRANHTGTQLSSTISDFAAAVQIASTSTSNGAILAFAAAQG